MSDVHCAACGEPWSIYHLKHDLIWEVISEDFWPLCHRYNIDPNYNLPTTIEDGGGLLPPETNVEKSISVVRSLWNDGRVIPDSAREALKKIGWEFGKTVLNVRHCACCPPQTPPKRNVLTDEAETLLAGDLDGLASTIEDLEVFKP